MAARHDITVDRGATFQLEVTWNDSDGVPVDLTDYTADLHFKEGTDAAGTLVALDEAAGLTLGGTLGTIDVEITAGTTATLPIDHAVYDLRLASSGGTVTRLLEGNVEIRPEVTAP